VVAKTLGKERAVRLHDLTLAIYGKAAAYAETKGVILRRQEVRVSGSSTTAILLIDEALTPDSSRYSVPKSGYKVGISPPSFDKQFVRDYLEEIKFTRSLPAPCCPRTS